MSGCIVAIWRTPADAAAFETHYNEKHVPLALQMPGLRKVQILKTLRPVMGDNGIERVVILHFDDVDAMKAAGRSAEGMAAGQDGAELSGGTLTMLGSSLEEITV